MVDEKTSQRHQFFEENSNRKLTLENAKLVVQFIIFPAAGLLVALFILYYMIFLASVLSRDLDQMTLENTAQVLKERAGHLDPIAVDFAIEKMTPCLLETYQITSTDFFYADVVGFWGRSEIPQANIDTFSDAGINKCGKPFILAANSIEDAHARYAILKEAGYEQYLDPPPSSFTSGE